MNKLRLLEEIRNDFVSEFDNDPQVKRICDIMINEFKARSKSLRNKKWAESRERTARVREQIAIEKFIEVLYDGDEELTFEEVNKRLKLH